MSEFKTLEELPDARSFTSLATISLANPHILHPDACNPAMDLVALLHERGGEEDDAGKPFDPKGKGKAAQGVTTTVVLWRLTGSKVWEVDVTGRVLGLAWSADGLYLTLLVLRLEQWTPAQQSPDASGSSIEHLSVHTGEVVKSVPLPPRLLGQVRPDDWTLESPRTERYRWWSMLWKESGTEWTSATPGSSLSIIDSLPRVTPVEPPKPAILNPFAIQVADKNKDKGYHAKLNKSAMLLPATTPLPPNILTVSSSSLTSDGPERLLTGTFLLPSGTPEPLSKFILGLAQRADAITTLLDIVVRGLESTQAVIKDGEKQTFLWRDELEICGDQQGMSVSDVHADLFKFLMTGRCGAAVSEWLGNRLANRAVTKWETTLHTEFTTIQNVLSHSVAPALERILLIVEELSGWTGETIDADLLLDKESIDRARSVTRGLLMLTEDMLQTATLEWTSSMEWFKWIRYEMARAVADDGGPIAIFDLKLVWSYMKNGFVSSRFKTHFPTDPGAKDEILPSSAISKPAPQAPDLNAVMSATLTKLLAHPGADEPIASPTQLLDHSFSPGRISSVRSKSPQVASSPDTVGDASMAVARPEETVERHPELEPWAWANTLIAACNDLVSSARPRELAVTKTSGTAGPVLPQRNIDGVEWTIAEQSSNLHVQVSESGNLQQGAFGIPDGEVLQAGFFDDDEVVVIFQHGGQRYLSAVQVAALGDGLQSGTREAASLPISRARPIGKARRGSIASWHLALNGNAGRRSGWVLTQGGTELEVFDMEGNEDDDDEAEEDEAMETE